MIRLFIVLMIVLLPLRGWAGGLMSIQLAMGGVGLPSASAMPPDCPMHAQSGVTDAIDTASSAPSGMDSCSSCELCIPMAELPDTRLHTLSFAAHAQPLMSGVDFTSAPPAPTLKPPIS